MNAARRINEVIVTQHAEDTAHLWTVRDRAAVAPNYRERDLRKLDARIDGHLDGLRTAGAEGLRIAEEQLETGRAGEVFVVTWLRLDRDERFSVPEIVRDADVDRKRTLARGCIAAISWAAPPRAAAAIRMLCASPSELDRYIGLAAAGNTRTAIGPVVATASTDPSPLVRARAFRVAGQMGFVPCGELVEAGVRDPDSDVRFWAGWCGVLLGDRGAGSWLRSSLTKRGARAEVTADLAGRAQPGAAALEWWRRTLAQDARLDRLAVRYATAMSLPEAMPWVIAKMRVTAVARLAGEAFTALTGIELAEASLEGPPPEDIDGGLNDDPEDEHVAADPDDGLPWPSPTAVERWWDLNGARFRVGQRHVVGLPAGSKAVRLALENGSQRRRIGAALDLALLKRGHPLFEVRQTLARREPAKDAAEPRHGSPA